MLKDWGIIGACITAALSMVAISITLGVFAASEIRQNSEFRGRTGARLDAIEANQRKSAALESPRKVFQEIGALDPKTFNINLPALRTVAEQPITEVNPSQPLLRKVADKLRNAPEASPEYWPTALQFIQFASSGLSADVPLQGLPASHLGNVVSTLAGGIGPFSHQTIVLDYGPIAGLRFENCRIIFGSAIIQMRNVIFVNCVFEFPRLDQPTPYLMQVARQLLSTGLTNAVVSIA